MRGTRTEANPIVDCLVDLFVEQFSDAVSCTDK
jgi:hypothetical protein